MKLCLLVDPALAPQGTAPDAEPLVELFPASGEFARAAPLLGPLLAEGRLPLEAALHVYAYECVERVRELERDGRLSGSRCVVPLWPAALFDAAGIRVHALRELETLLPEERVIAWRRPRAADVRRAAQACVAFPALDARAYVAALQKCAAREGWARW